MKNLQSVLNTISNLNTAELDMIINAVKARHNKIATNLLTDLRIGDTVIFDAGRRGNITGEVTKINPKTIQVRGLGQLWKVSAPLCKKVA